MDCLHEQQWSELLSNLSINLKHEDLDVQMTANTALGYICQVLHQDKITCLNPLQVDSMISGICVGLQDYDGKTLTALKSLECSISFLSQNLSKPTISDYLMNLLVKIHITALERQEIDMLKQNILCLTEICKIIYGNFAKYYQVIFPHVIKTYTVMDKGLLMVTNEFFMTILECETHSDDLRFLSEFVVNLLEKILESLIQILPEEVNMHSDDEIIEVQNSCVYLMTSLNSLYIDITFPNLVKFIEVYIDKNDLVSKCVALSALESLIENRPSERIYEILKNVVDGIVKEFSQKNIRIQLQTSMILSKIALHYPNIFMESNNFNKIYQSLMNFMSVKINSFHIFKNVCDSFNNAARSFDQLNPQAQNSLVSVHEAIIECLLRILNMPNIELFFIDTIYSTIMSLINHVIPTNNLSKWFTLLWSRLEGMNNLNDITRATIESIFVNLNVIVQSLIMHNKKLELGNNHKNKIEEIVKFIIEMFKSFQEILSEPLIFIVSLIENEPVILEACVYDLMKDYIATAIEQTKDNDLFISGINCVGHLVKTYGDKMTDFVERLMPFMIESLNNMSIQKETKIHIFLAVSDIGAHCPRSLQTHLDSIFKLLELAFNAVISLIERTDTDSKTYCCQLKDTMIDLLLCLIHGIYFTDDSSEDIQNLKNFFPKVFDFIQITTQKIYKPEILFMIDCLQILMDINLKDSTFSLSTKQLCLTLFEELSTYQHIQKVQEVLVEVRKYLYNNQDPSRMNQLNY